jgi:hypothetical protein
VGSSVRINPPLSSFLPRYELLQMLVVRVWCSTRSRMAVDDTIVEDLTLTLQAGFAAWRCTQTRVYSANHRLAQSKKVPPSGKAQRGKRTSNALVDWCPRCWPESDQSLRNRLATRTSSYERQTLAINSIKEITGGIIATTRIKIPYRKARCAPFIVTPLAATSHESLHSPA